MFLVRVLEHIEEYFDSARSEYMFVAYIKPLKNLAQVPYRVLNELIKAQLAEQCV